MNNYIKKIVFLLLITVQLLLAGLSLAATPPSNDPYARTQAAAGITGYNTLAAPTVPEVIIIILNYLLSFLGIIFVILILLAGYQWMTSAGNQEAISKARGHLKNAVMGLIVVALAYAITVFVADFLVKSSTPGYYSWF